VHWVDFFVVVVVVAGCFVCVWVGAMVGGMSPDTPCAAQEEDYTEF